MTITTYPNPEAKAVTSQGFVDYADKPGEFTSFKTTSAPQPPEAKRLRQVRSARRMTLLQGAGLLGLDVTEMSDLERGRRLPVEGWDAVFEIMEAS